MFQKSKIITITILLIFTIFTIISWPNTKLRTINCSQNFNKIRKISNKEYTIEKQIPVSAETLILFFKSNYYKVNIFLDDNLIYSYEENNKLIANQLLKININPSQDNRIIKINLKSTFRKPLLLPKFNLTTTDQFYKHLIYNFLPIFLFSFIFFILSLGCLLNYFYQKVKNVDSDSSIFLIFLTFLTSIWIITDSSYISLFITNIYAIVIINFLSFKFIPLALLFQNNKAFKKYPRIFFIIFTLNIINVFLSTLFQLIGFKTFYDTLIFTHLIYFLTFITLIYIYWKDFKAKVKNSKIMLVGILVYAGALFACLISFLLQKQYSILFFLGTFLYFISLLYISIENNRKQLKKVQELSDKAYIDDLTKVRNRYAYNMTIQELEGKIRLSIIDINGLKRVNDKFGHQKGDELIITCASILKNIFSVEQVFRFGGDEFVIIERNYTNSSKKIDRDIEEAIAKSQNINLSISKGTVEFDLNKNDTKEYQRYLKKADKIMYQQKEDYYKKNNQLKR